MVRSCLLSRRGFACLPGCAPFDFFGAASPVSSGTDSVGFFGAASPVSYGAVPLAFSRRTQAVGGNAAILMSAARSGDWQSSRLGGCCSFARRTPSEKAINNSFTLLSFHFPKISQDSFQVGQTIFDFFGYPEVTIKT